jgi:hypothetical protein
MRQLACASLLLFALAAGAQEDNRVFVIYDEQEINDANRAHLYDLLLQTIPAGEEWWRQVDVTEPTSLRWLLDHHYDYWDNKTKDRDGNPFKQTVDLLVRWIKKKNGLTSENVPKGKLWLPPVPVAGKRDESPKAFPARLFNPKTRQYALLRRLDVIGQATTRDDDPVKQNDFRDAKLTFMEIPHALQAAEFIRANGLKLPTGVMVRRANAMAALSLEPPNDNILPDDCAPRATALAGSPRLAMTTQELALRRQTLDKVLLAAEAMPLWIVDWDTEVPGGHGNKVHVIVQGILRDLGLPELIDHVHTFDLNPVNNEEGLRDTLEAYRGFYEGNENFKPATMDLALKGAKGWIDAKDVRKTADGKSDGKQVIDEFVLQSVFWRFLFNEPSWVNFSFETRYPQGQILNALYMESSQSFATIAAGNERVVVSAGTYPQAGAALYDKLVNVTYGRPDGWVLGALNGTIPVHLSAPGCGFTYDGIAASDRGSSFASPYVAVTSWVEALTNGLSPADMRARLLDAVQPTAFDAKNRVASGGTYDPTLLYRPATQQPHILMKDGTTRSIPGALLTLNAKKLDSTRTLVTQYETVTNTTGARLRVLPCADDAAQQCVSIKEPGKDVDVKRFVSLLVDDQPVDMANVVDVSW